MARSIKPVKLNTLDAGNQFRRPPSSDKQDKHDWQGKVIHVGTGSVVVMLASTEYDRDTKEHVMGKPKRTEIAPDTLVVRQ